MPLLVPLIGEERLLSMGMLVGFLNVCLMISPQYFYVRVLAVIMRMIHHNMYFADASLQHRVVSLGKIFKLTVNFHWYILYYLAFF